MRSADEHQRRKHRERDEPARVAAVVLLGIGQRVGQDRAAQRADLADHAARDRRRGGPAQRHELEQRAVAQSQRREAAHEQDRP